MKQWLQSWTIIRLLRLGMGLAIIYQGIDLQQWLIVILGGIFSLMPLLNMGCCNTSGCTNMRYSNPKNKDKPTTFTEIK